jgi:hypothetical protein
LNYEPEGAIEKMGNALGVVSSRVEGDLQRFKDFIEARGSETGGWRGEIRGSQTTGERGARAENERVESEPRSKRLRDETPKI